MPNSGTQILVHILDPYVIGQHFFSEHAHGREHLRRISKSEEEENANKTANSE
jgi:hypothetical protein